MTKISSLFLFLFCSIVVFANSKIDVSKYNEPFLIGTYSSIAEGSLNDSILAISNKLSWITSENEIIALDVPLNGKWTKTRVSNLRSINDEFSLEVNLPTLDTLIAFVVHEGNIISRAKAIEAEPFTNRKVGHQTFVIDLPQGYNDLEVFMYVSSVEQVNLPVSLASSKDQFVGVTTRDLSFGIYLGIILAMFFYNAFVFYSTKDISYIYYVVYIGFVGMVQVALEGYGFRYLWPDSPNWQKISLNFLNMGTAVSAYLFFASFIRLKKLIPNWKWPFYALITIYIVQFFLSSFGFGAEAYSMMNVSALLLSFLFIFASVVAIFKGSRQAVFFIFAWSAFLASVIIFVLKDLGVVSYNLFTSNVLQFGSGLEVVLLSFGLADRINTLRRDRDANQQKALLASKENARIIEEQNRVLEEKVTERTSKLNLALKEVKNAQTQMVEQEKMASLGQLTAGIAHEINNPINFVSANINPLKRDLDDVFELVDQYESISGKDDFDLKKKEIEEFKEEIELDYVRNEISELISGITEGAKRTAEIVRGLKVFSRVDEQDLKKVDLIQGIDSTLTLLRSSMKAGVTIEKNYEPLQRVECYGGKMNQVFMNILSNAAQAIQENAITDGVISITTKDDGDSVIIVLSDNAGGIPEDNLKKIFEPFFTTKPVGSGTGLGLAIAKGIIDSHSGKIDVDSIVGEGTTFTIKLPKTQPQKND